MGCQQHGEGWTPVGRLVRVLPTLSRAWSCQQQRDAIRWLPSPFSFHSLVSCTAVIPTCASWFDRGGCCRFSPPELRPSNRCDVGVFEHHCRRGAAELWRLLFDPIQSANPTVEWGAAAVRRRRDRERVHTYLQLPCRLFGTGVSPSRGHFSLVRLRHCVRVLSHRCVIVAPVL